MKTRRCFKDKNRFHECFPVKLDAERAERQKPSFCWDIQYMGFVGVPTTAHW